MAIKKNIDDDKKRDLNILIIDDDDVVLKTISKILSKSNPLYFIETTQCVEKALELASKTYWDTILLDLSLPYHHGGVPDPKNGLYTLDFLKNELHITSPIIAITGYNDDELSETVLDKGAYYFLTKPLRAKFLSSIVRNATTFHMSGFDGLTGLLNRITFEERLKSEFERVKRKNQENNNHQNNSLNSNSVKSYLSLIFVDGDDFKIINDTYNHLVGDQLLKKIGLFFIDESIYKIRDKHTYSYKYIIRPYDIAARFGGDEFSIFLPETNHHSALTVAKRIKDQMKKYDISDLLSSDYINPHTKRMTLSIGIATYPEPNNVDNYKDLILCADSAMYASKEHKKGEIFGYNLKGEIIKLK